MRIAIWIVVAFGVIVLSGGLIGYLTKQSLPSLMAGSAFGATLLGSAYALSQGINKAHYIALILAVLLTLFFHLRYIQCGFFIPSGLMAIISCLVTVALLILRPRKQ